LGISSGVEKGKKKSVYRFATVKELYHSVFYVSLCYSECIFLQTWEKNFDIISEVISLFIFKQKKEGKFPQLQYSSNVSLVHGMHITTCVQMLLSPPEHPLHTHAELSPGW
jgi:hypothetical protein